jgi:hypothetical protein
MYSVIELFQFLAKINDLVVALMGGLHIDVPTPLGVIMRKNPTRVCIHRSASHHVSKSIPIDFYIAWCISDNRLSRGGTFLYVYGTAASV